MAWLHPNAGINGEGIYVQLTGRGRHGGGWRRWYLVRWGRGRRR